MIVAPTVTTIDIRHVLFVMLKHNVWYHILLFSKPQLRTATTGSYTAPPPWSSLYTYAHTELDEYHTIIVNCCQLCEYFRYRDPASHLLPVLSHRPVLRNIFVVKILLCSMPERLLSCTAESRIQTSVIGRRGTVGAKFITCARNITRRPRVAPPKNIFSPIFFFIISK